MWQDSALCLDIKKPWFRPRHLYVPTHNQSSRDYSWNRTAMVHPNCWCLTFWLSLIAFTAAQNHAEPSSVQELQAYSLFIEDVCVYLYQIAVCSTSIPIWSGVTYSIMAGFAQGTRSYACLKPKWRENWSVPKGSSLDMIFKLKKDYCIYSRSATPDHDVLLTCINTCYDGGPIQNPSFYRSFGEIGYDQAKWDNPDHGTYNDRYPEKCKRFQADQHLLQSTTECPQPSSSAFNNPGTTNPETATAENVDDLYQQTLPPGTTNPETATAENVDNPY